MTSPPQPPNPADMGDVELPPPISLLPNYQYPFRDDLGLGFKVLRQLNSFRKLYGFKNVESNNVLHELAIQRNREFTRSKRLKTALTINGAKFNVGIRFADVVLYIPIEYENGKMVPEHKSIRNAWNFHDKCARMIVEPLVNFAGVSVSKNNTTICFTVLLSRLPPFFFPPKIYIKKEIKIDEKEIEAVDNMLKELDALAEAMDDDKNEKHEDGAGKISDDEMEADIEQEGNEPKTEAASHQRVICKLPQVKIPTHSMPANTDNMLSNTENILIEGRKMNEVAMADEDRRNEHHIAIESVPNHTLMCPSHSNEGCSTQ